jgi:hypothetical protein
MGIKIMLLTNPGGFMPCLEATYMDVREYRHGEREKVGERERRRDGGTEMGGGERERGRNS